MSLSLEPDIITLDLKLSSSSSASPPKALNPEERGIRLIQLLLTCVNHVSSGNLHRADACLRQITQLSSISGDSMQRLASHFASALALRLLRCWPGLYKAVKCSHSSTQELDQAPFAFSKSFPYLGIAYAILAHTLLQSMFEESIIHIVGLGCTDPRFWASIIQGIKSRQQKSTHLKITCVNGEKEVLEKLTIELEKEAEIFELPLQFTPVHVSLRDLTKDMLKVGSGEALAIISVLNLHELLAEDDSMDAHFGANKSNIVKECRRLDQFLVMVKSMSPKVVCLVEQEADHNLSRLKDRFRECLHYYSALFESLDVKFGSFSSEERWVLEGRFGREIENIVACEGLERKERHERYARWMVRFGRAGFRPVRLWYAATEEVKQGMGGDGEDNFKVIKDKASLIICWHDRPLYAVSAWIS